MELLVVLLLELLLLRIRFLVLHRGQELVVLSQLPHRSSAFPLQFPSEPLSLRPVPVDVVVLSRDVVLFEPWIELLHLLHIFLESVAQGRPAHLALEDDLLQGRGHLTQLFGLARVRRLAKVISHGSQGLCQGLKQLRRRGQLLVHVAQVYSRLVGKVEGADLERCRLKPLDVIRGDIRVENVFHGHLARLQGLSDGLGLLRENEEARLG
mmetsp:Transcript_13361/g.37497  ORF Transcript_13361/g.37497 Transcript_13361/m.37497 type:complete len:210 (-) Transcript_13361:113-742(-)